MKNADHERGGLVSIRNAAKALIIQEDEIHLITYSARDGIRYTLPGGGQNQYETMEEAVQRECLEETGYHVRVLRLAAIYEEIYLSSRLREKYPDYAHKIHHIFLCAPESSEKLPPSETDLHQTGSVWVPVKQAAALPLYPQRVRARLAELISSPHPIDLGSEHIAERIPT